MAPKKTTQFLLALLVCVEISFVWSHAEQWNNLSWRKALLLKTAVELKQQVFMVENLFAKAKDSQTHLGTISIECGLCGIVANEIEGFLAENLTETEIELELKQGICLHLSDDLASLCNEFIDVLPQMVDAIERNDDVGVVCVDLQYCTAPFIKHSDPRVPPSFVLDLDLPPSQRWAQICSIPTYQNVTQWIVRTAKSLLSDGGAVAETLGKAINDYYLPTEYAQEIRGCAGALNISYGWLTMMNLGYELSDACTSIVAQTVDGKIYHARNLDFWDGMGFTDSLKDVAFELNFQKGGKTIFSATTFSGFVGVLSGFKPGAFSITIDTRFYPGGVGQLFYEVIAAIVEKNASLVTFLSRDVLTNENQFESAILNLSEDELIADVYYILAGVSSGEGAVISRNRQNSSDIWRLNSPERWFEVETNYDHWKQPPWFDNRVVPANRAMLAMGQQNLTLEGMYQVLSTKPIMNLQTTYSILACPADGTYKSFIRYCQYPCVE